MKVLQKNTIEPLVEAIKRDSQETTKKSIAYVDPDSVDAVVLYGRNETMTTDSNTIFQSYITPNWPITCQGMITAEKKLTTRNRLSSEEPQWEEIILSKL